MTELQKKSIRGGGVRTTVAMAVAGLLLLAAGGYLWWTQRPGRPYVVVGEHELSKSELDRYARARMENARNRNMLTQEQTANPEVLEKYRREAVQMWVFRTVLLDEALRRKFKATPADERRFRNSFENALRRNKLGQTIEDYFKSGALPEEELRARYREDVLVHMLLQEDVIKNMPRPSGAEVEAALAERRRSGVAKATRREVEDDLYRASYNRALRAYYLKLLGATTVHPRNLAPVEPPKENFGSAMP